MAVLSDTNLTDICSGWEGDLFSDLDHQDLGGPALLHLHELHKGEGLAGEVFSFQQGQ